MSVSFWASSNLLCKADNCFCFSIDCWVKFWFCLSNVLILSLQSVTSCVIVFTANVYSELFPEC